MQSLFLTEYIKSDIFTHDLYEKITNRDLNFDLIISDINYNQCPILSISPNSKPENASLIDAWKDTISTAKHPLIILNELNFSFLSPLFELIEDKKHTTIINLNTGLGSFEKKISPEINDLDIVPESFKYFEPIDLENLQNILKQNWKQYIRLLHREMPSSIFDVDELWIVDAKMLESLDGISMQTYGFVWNDGTLLASWSLFATAIHTWQILQEMDKELSLFVLQNLNFERTNEIVDSIKTTKKLFILIDHADSTYLRTEIEKRLKKLNLNDIQINIISPKYSKLTTIFNEYQEEQTHFDPEYLAKRISSKL